MLCTDESMTLVEKLQLIITVSKSPIRVNEIIWYVVWINEKLLGWKMTTITCNVVNVCTKSNSQFDKL